MVDQLRQHEPSRRVQVLIEAGITARCDSKFARIILENLIGNAWKYSRDRADAKDNGAGFNMAFSASLAVASQRAWVSDCAPATPPGMRVRTGRFVKLRS